ncbi:TPA: hypothetical protein ENS27_10095 [bacterium]|nr:hypothetical protein [bacterium]
MKNIKTFLILITTFTVLVSCNYNQQKAMNDHRPDLLKRLDGNWHAVGKVIDKAVEYSVNVEPVLNNTFSRIHMRDINNPPQYEAQIFVGVDSATNTVYAHWLDSFGPSYSVPHGTGKIQLTSIEFVIPYPDSPFRDIFKYDKDNDTWTLLIESYSDSTKVWNKFASYEFKRKRN